MYKGHIARGLGGGNIPSIALKLLADENVQYLGELCLLPGYNGLEWTGANGVVRDGTCLAVFPPSPSGSSAIQHLLDFPCGYLFANLLDPNPATS